jgi:hypothetical protein
VRRLFLGLIGLALAIPAGAVFLAVAGLLAPETRDLAGDLTIASALALLSAAMNGEGPDLAFAAAAGGFWALATAMLCLPPILTAAIGAAAGVGSYVWYAGGSGVLTIAIAWLGHPAGQSLDTADGKILALLFLTGAVSGLVYWAIAGREMGPVGPAPSAS